MDYEGIINDVFCIRERAMVILRNWSNYPYSRFSNTQDQWYILIYECNQFMHQLYTEDKTQKIVFG